MKRRKLALAMGLAASMMLSACQPSPDSSIVRNKDFDNMLAEAGNTENGTSSVADLAQNYDVYQTTIQNDSLQVTVNVDAQVDIPKTDSMSVMRVRQSNLTQELLDRVRQTLAPDVTFYDASAFDTQTRDQVEQEIQGLKVLQNEVEDDGVSREEIQREIDELQEKYESAPLEVTWSDYLSDGLIHSTAERYEQDRNNATYAWQHEMNPDGEVFYSVSDGKDGRYISLYVQNNEDYGNCIRYSRDRHAYVDVDSVVADRSCHLGRWLLEDGFPAEGVLLEGVSEDSLTEYADTPLAITQEQAKEQAGELLQALGMTDFSYYEGGMYGEIISPDYIEGEKLGYRKVYILKYLRNIDGVFVNNEGGGKLVDGWSGDDYVKKMWVGESIEVIVDDEGIAGFYYCSPMEIVETVVEQASMKSFEEIKDIFEQMVVVTNALGSDEEDKVTIDIDRVVLRYTRISERDSFDTGLLVPVWDFMGRNLAEKPTAMFGVISSEDTCIMTVNAIDGTVIDRELGY